MTKKLPSDPRSVALKEKRTLLNRGLRYGGVSNSTRVIMRYLAMKEPEIFGAWKDLPDQEETSRSPTRGTRPEASRQIAQWKAFAEGLKPRDQGQN